MNGRMVRPAPPCPLLIGPGGKVTPMHGITACGPALVAANEGVHGPDVERLHIGKPGFFLFSAGTDPMDWKPDPGTGWML